MRPSRSSECPQPLARRLAPGRTSCVRAYRLIARALRVLVRAVRWKPVLLRLSKVQSYAIATSNHVPRVRTCEERCDERHHDSECGIPVDRAVTEVRVRTKRGTARYSDARQCVNVHLKPHYDIIGYITRRKGATPIPVFVEKKPYKYNGSY